MEVPVHCVPYEAELLKEGLVLLEEPQGATQSQLILRRFRPTRTRLDRRFRVLDMPEIRGHRLSDHSF